MFNRKTIQLQNFKFVLVSFSTSNKVKKIDSVAKGDLCKAIVLPSSGLSLLGTSQYKHTYSCSAAKVNQRDKYIISLVISDCLQHKTILQSSPSLASSLNDI